MSGEAGKTEFYRKRAADLRVLADRLRTLEAKQLLLRIAGDYERLAANLEKRQRER